MSAPARAAGWLLLLVPLLPLQALFGEIERTRGLVPPGEALLGMFVFGALAVLVARLVPPAAPQRLLVSLEREKGPASLIPAAALPVLLALLVGTATFAFARRPLLVDSVIQLFQAKIFASGRLAAAAPPGEEFFAVQHMLVDAGRWYSQYPPGHSALLSVGTSFESAWVVPVVLTAGTALLLYGFVRRAYDLATARVTLILLVGAPFFWFMGASHMNHVSTLFFISAFLYLLARWEDGGGPVALFAASLAIGGAFLSRPLTAAAVGVALAPFVVRRAWSRRDLASITCGGVGVLAAVASYLAYNAATTGDPLLPGYIKLWGTSHGLGFHTTPWGEVHSPLAGLRNELTDLTLLSSFLFEWPIPALVPAGVLFAAGWATRRWDGRLGVAFAAIPIAYLFYWHRDAFLGPRFLYSGVAFLLPLTARGLLELFRRIAGRPVWRRSALLRVPASSALAALLVLCFLYAAVYSTPARFRVYRTGLASMKLDLAGAAREAHVTDALVFVSVSWGNRLLARMRGAGVPASEAETAYRTTDHCVLELLLTRADAEGWEIGPLAAAIREADPAGEPVPAGSPFTNGDPTLRLAPGRRPHPRCLDEIAYDRAGYANFTPFLADQDPSLSGPVVIARDLRERNRDLRAVYPDRVAWLFRAGRFVRLGEPAN